MKKNTIVLMLAVLSMLLLASGAVAQDKEDGGDLLKAFLSDRRPEIEKIADDPGRMEEYVLSQKDVNVGYKGGRTLLHYAAIQGYLSVAQLLVEKGAKVNARDNDGRTPLHDAMSYHAYDVAKFLVRNGADMALKNKDGATPLFAVVYTDGNDPVVTELVSFFIERGFDVRKSADADLLDQSIRRGHKDIALVLLNKGIRIDDASLFAAASAGYDDIFTILLSKGARPKQEGILHAACGSGSLAIVKTLVEKGEGPAARDIDSALYQGHLDVAVYLNDVLKKTGKQTVDLRRLCDLKPASGRCKALFYRGYYDAATKACREFVYGGCDGVAPFHSVEACRNVCEDILTDRGVSPREGKDR
jgi:ankyrin repeat protein